MKHLGIFDHCDQFKTVLMINVTENKFPIQ